MSRCIWRGLIVAFLLSIALRWSEIGILDLGGHQWVTAATINFIKNWNSEGLLRSAAVMHDDPHSVEFNYGPRILYSQYPPGFAIPPYLAFKLLGVAPGALSVQVWGLFLNLIEVIFVALILQRILRAFEPWIRDLSTFMALVAYLFSHQMLYFHFKVFFADQAILSLWLALLYFYLRVEEPGSSPYWKGAIHLLLFLIALTDWYAISILLVYYLVRFRESNRVDKAIEDLWPAFFAYLLYAIQLSYSGGWGLLHDRFVERAGIRAMIDDPLLGASLLRLCFQVFDQHVGRGTLLCLIAAVTLFYLKFLHDKNRKNFLVKKNPYSTSFLMLCMLPPIIHTALLSNHSWVHGFSSLKFIVPFSLLACGVMSALLLDYQRNSKIIGWKKVLIIILSFGPLVYTLSFAPLYRDFISAAKLPPPRMLHVFEWIGSFQRFDDIFFSHTFQVTVQPPHGVALARKRVWAIRDENDIQNWILAFPGAEKHPMVLVEELQNQRIRECIGVYQSLGAEKLGEAWNFAALRFDSIESFARLTSKQKLNCP